MSSYAYTTFGADEVIRPRETCAALRQNREQGDRGNSAITRRRLIGAAGCSAALAGSGMAFPGLLKADAAVPNLPTELPQGLRAVYPVKQWIERIQPRGLARFLDPTATKQASGRICSQIPEAYVNAGGCSAVGWQRAW